MKARVESHIGVMTDRKLANAVQRVLDKAAMRMSRERITREVCARAAGRAHSFFYTFADRVRVGVTLHALRKRGLADYWPGGWPPGDSGYVSRGWWSQVAFDPTRPARAEVA